MSAVALVLVLAAAFVHAAWNLLIAGAPDSRATTAVALVAGGVLLVPIAALTWHTSAAVWPIAAGSAALELVYFALLARAYDRDAMSAVYPVARGSAPVLVALVSALVGRVPSLVQVGGIGLVVLGVLAVRGVDWRAAAPGLLIGAAIAGYTLLDKEGVRYASPAAYLALTQAPAAVISAIALRRRLRAAVSWRAVLAGVGVMGSYGLVLAALQRAAAAAVAAVRECSVVIAVVLAAVVLRERVSPARMVGAAAVAAGVAVVALG